MLTSTGQTCCLLQVEVHPYWRSTDLLEYSRSVGIHLSAYSPLGSQVPEHEDLVKDPVVTKIAKDLGKTPGQVGVGNLAETGSL